MRKVFYGVLSLFLFISCSSPSGDRTTTPDISNPIVEDEFFVSDAEASEIANEFFANGHLTLIGTDKTDGLRSTADGLPAYYIFSNEGNGFVIVSASKTAYPILGYSETGSIDQKNMPDGLRYMLSLYSGTIDEARKQGIAPSADMQRLRDRLKLRAKEPAGEVKVEPLLKDIAWNQSPYYNALTPNPQVPVGCVATATSQILRYWKYPDKAIGHHQYTSRIFGLISFDFNHTFDWNNMPAETLTGPNEDIAILCYGVAVAINMNFDYSYNGGSGAVHGDVPPALYRHYGYPKTVTNISRNDYDEATWTAIVRNELDHRRPVQYGGSGKGGGHSFVIDGYDETNLFHVNWGWGGQSNGWFKLNALDPDELGTGGGSGGFNHNQDMIIHFAPPARIEGDNHDAVIDEDENDGGILDNGVTYPAIYVFNTLDFYIRYTRFGDVVTTSSGSGYASYFTKNIIVNAGEKLEYNVEMSVNETSSSPKLGIFIDYNDDGQFTSAEKVFETPAGEAPLSVHGSYVIPTDARKGLHRMRVITTNIILRNPNKAIPNGEVEDYYVTIK